MNPKAFGLSAYAVVDTPETPETPETTEPEAEVAPAVAEAPQKPSVYVPVQPIKTTSPAPPLTGATLLHQDKSVNKKTQIIPDMDEETAL
jgi:hypothetical protein